VLNLWKRLSALLTSEKSKPATSLPPSLPDDEPEISVPELTVDQLQMALATAEPPLVIDVREPYEWRLVRLPTAMNSVLHIPMNDLPNKLAGLPHDHEIVVLCAHGSRSYSVAAWLNEQGYHASSLAGGITEWARRGGMVEQG
jgi:rhodanese-related sulfurtransferase